MFKCEKNFIGFNFFLKGKSNSLTQSKVRINISVLTYPSYASLTFSFYLSYARGWMTC